MDFQSLGDKLFFAVLARGLVWLRVSAVLVFDDAVGGQHDVCVQQGLDVGLPLVAVVDDDLEGESVTLVFCNGQFISCKTVDSFFAKR